MIDRNAYPMHAQEPDKENKDLKARNKGLETRVEKLEKKVLGGRVQSPL